MRRLCILLLILAACDTCGESEPAGPAAPETETQTTSRLPEPPAPQRPVGPPCEAGIVETMRAGGSAGMQAARTTARTCIVREEEVGALSELVRSDETPAGIRMFAARGLARAAPPEQAIPPVAAALQRDDEQEMFAALCRLIQRNPRSPEAHRALIFLLPHLGTDDERAFLATPAAAALGPDLPGLLIEHLRSSDPERRAHAARVLGTISDLQAAERDTVIEALETATSDSDETVRTAAAASLEHVRGRAR